MKTKNNEDLKLHKVAKHLESGGTITRAQSYKWFGHMSLAKSIWTLREKRGYLIDMQLKTAPDGTRYGEYKLIQKPKQND